MSSTAFLANVLADLQLEIKRDVSFELDQMLINGFLANTIEPSRELRPDVRAKCPR